MRFLAICASLLFASSFAAAGTVTVTAPTEGSTSSTSMKVTSTTTSPNTITTTMVYVDYKAALKVKGAVVDTNLTVSTGLHKVMVQSWDEYGNVLQSDLIHVTAQQDSTQPPPTSSKVYKDIEQMSGWESCDKCAGRGGDGSSAIIKMVQNLLTPSLDGHSAKYYLEGSQPYSAGIWWKQLGPDPTVSNFSYEMYFYLKNPSAAQGLEFDVNQSMNGKKFIFGTQCDIKDHHDWDVWDGIHSKWMQTGIACSAPAAYSWNHLILEFQREGAKMKFVSVTLNGKKSYFNKSYYAQSSSAKELNVAVQLDGNGSNDAYNLWADNITLKTW